MTSMGKQKAVFHVVDNRLECVQLVAVISSTAGDADKTADVFSFQSIKASTQYSELMA